MHPLPFGTSTSLAAKSSIPSTPEAPAGLRSATVPGYATTWVANSLGLSGMPDYSPAGTYSHVTQSAAGMTVLPNGVVVTNARWDEGHYWMGMYRDGRVVGQLACPYQPNTGWGGDDITNNGSYIFATQNSGYGSGTGSYPYANFIGRWKLNGTAAPFSGARPNDRSGNSCGNLQVVDTTGNGHILLFGIAASSSEVFVTDPNTNQIKVYDAYTMSATPKRLWSFPHPRRIAYDPATNTLWISQGTSIQPNQKFQGSIYHEDINGNLLTGTIADVARPSALTVYNGKLYVADDGPDQQIKIYTNKGTHAMPYTFGAQHGYLGGAPGIVTATKLVRPNGIGFDSSGSIYILGSAPSLDDGLREWLNWTTDIRKYASSGSLVWQLASPGSFDDNAVADATTDGQDLYSAMNHYKFDYEKLTTGDGNGGKEWSWYSQTLDPFTYPHDPRHYLNFPNIAGVQTIAGNKYLEVVNQYAGAMVLYRMIGEVAKPFAMFQNKPEPAMPPYAPDGAWIWQDTSGDGEPQSNEYVHTTVLNYGDKLYQLDTNGDIWTANYVSAAVGRFPMQGIVAGRLTYAPASYINYGKPSIFSTVQYMQYDRVHDVMYVSGFTPSLPGFYAELQGDGAGKSAGTVLAKYNGFLAWWQAHPGTWPGAAWTISLPHSQALDQYISAWQVAGSKLFAGLLKTTCLNGLGSPQVCDTRPPPAYSGSWDPRTVQHNIYVYDTTSGAFLGEMKPGMETHGMIGWIDQVQCLSAFQRSNGEYVVIEMEQKGAKQTVLRGMLNNFTQY